MPLPRVVVVGLGPGDADLLTVGTRDAIDRISVRFVRTTRHPAARVVGDAVSFDDVYDSGSSLAEVYSEIAERVIAAAVVHGEVLYAVPGSPVVAEHTVELLLADPRVEVEIVPALSFLDLAWARLGVDPVAAGVRIVDGHRFAVEAAGERGPLLVAQCDSGHVLSDVKLVLDAGLDPCLADGATVVVLQRLGLPDERVERIGWLELDRIEADHLTSVYVEHLVQPVSRELARYVELVDVLRVECPWDAEQTHESLRRHLLEESYEVLEALDGLDVEAGEGYDHLEEELGDLLFQILFHARLAAEQGRFTIADVAAGGYEKLVSRHPHVFGELVVDGPDDVVRNWEHIKKAEKGRESVFDGVPDALPALLFALKVRKKAASIGLADLPLEGAPSELRDAIGAFEAAPDERSAGELLFAVVDAARDLDIDPETALRAAAVRHRDAARTSELGADLRD